MKLPTLLSAMALMAMLTFSCSTDSIDDNIEDAVVSNYIPQTKIIEIEILELINDHRISIGINALNDMSTIKAVAYGHTDYMIDQEEISHDNFYTRRNSLINNVGAENVGENVAYAYSSAQSVVNAWLNSPGHKEVIEGDYTDFDISAEKNEEDKWYFTNIFIKK